MAEKKEKEVENFIVNKLEDIGIDRADLLNLSVTTKELGLSSLELVDLSLSIEEQYGISLRLVTQEEISIDEICNRIIRT